MFFFKQKTAYEMRISDWSSDVCSSDLLAITIGRHRQQEFLMKGQLLEAVIAQAVRDIGNVRLAFLARAAQRAGLAQVGIPLLDGDVGMPEDEIGRASGRERVCQYV